MNTNENILKSLANLEQNLKNINSAREQVNQVLRTSTDLASAFESYQSSFDDLTKNLSHILDASKKLNNESYLLLNEQTKKLSSEILKLENFNFKNSFKEVNSSILSRIDKLEIEIFENSKKQSNILFSRFEQQEKESKVIKNLLFATLGVLIVGIILNIAL